MGALHLGISTRCGGSASLYHDQTPLAAFDEPTSPVSAHTSALPREAIKACLRAARLQWSHLSSVTITGERGALERLNMEYADLKGFEGLAPTQLLSSHRALVECALYERAVHDAVVFVSAKERPGQEDQGVRQSSYALYSYHTPQDHPPQAPHPLEPELLFEGRYSGAHSALACPISAYLTLAERAREALHVTLTEGSPLLTWASSLATQGEPLPTLKTWFSLKPQSFKLRVASYEMWLEVSALERRLTTQPTQRHSDQLKGALWASLLYKAQQELLSALLELAQRALKHTRHAHFMLAGDLSLDPTLCDELKRGLPVGCFLSVPLSPKRALSLGAALMGARQYQQRDPAQAPQHTPLPSHLKALSQPKQRSQVSARETLISTERAEELSAALTSFESALHVEELELLMSSQRFAQRLLQGDVIAFYEGPTPLSAHAQTSRLYLADPSQGGASQRLNHMIGLDLSAPTLLLCPQGEVGELFEDADPHERSPQRARLKGEPTPHPSPLLVISPQARPKLVALCEALKVHFNHPPLLLSAPLTTLSGRLVDHMIDAFHVLINARCSALMMGSRWISSRLPAASALTAPLGVMTQQQRPSLSELAPTLTYKLSAELRELNELLFEPERESVLRSAAELQELSRRLARYRPLSDLYGDPLLSAPLLSLKPSALKSSRAPSPSLKLNPHGLTQLSDMGERWPTRLYTWSKALTLIALGKERAIAAPLLSQRLQQLPYERKRLQLWAFAELEGLGLSVHESWRAHLLPSRPALSSPPTSSALLSAFQDPKAQLYEPLFALWSALKRCDYHEEALEPFRFERSPRPLTTSPQDLLVRLFWLGQPLSRHQLSHTLGDEVTQLLISLGVLTGREELHALVRVDCVAGVYLASDPPSPRQLPPHERPCPPLSALERGLVRLALSTREGSTLDRSHTLAGVGVAQAKLLRRLSVIAPHERAARLMSFNLQLNGVRGYELSVRAEGVRFSGPAHDNVFTRRLDDLSHAGALLNPYGRLTLLSEDLSLASKTPISVLHRALALPITSHLTRLATLDDPRLSEGFGAVSGYWVIAQEEELPQPQRGSLTLPHLLYRPLCAAPCERLHEYIERYFQLSLSSITHTHLHPSTALEKQLKASGEASFSVRHLSYTSLAPISLPDELYAQLKALISQQQPSPLNHINVSLMTLGFQEPSR